MKCKEPKWKELQILRAKVYLVLQYFILFTCFFFFPQKFYFIFLYFFPQKFYFYILYFFSSKVLYFYIFIFYILYFFFPQKFYFFILFFLKSFILYFYKSIVTPNGKERFEHWFWKVIPCSNTYIKYIFMQIILLS